MTTTPSLNRRLAVILAVGAALTGGVVGAVVAGSAPSSVLNASTAASNATPTPPANAGERPHGPFHGRGAVGTVTAINTSNSSLTLRTLLGSLTVTTSGTTKYTREGATIAFGDIKNGDVVRVEGTPSGGTSTTPPTSIAANHIAIAVPGAMGRVQSVQGNTITLVLRDGQLATVTTSGSTTYRNRDGSSANASDVKPGTFIRADGQRTGVRDLTADVITIVPAPHMGGAPAGEPTAGGAPAGAGVAPAAFGDAGADLTF